MSDIPKSKRAHSNLEAHHQALAVRRMISVELLSSFAYSEKKLEAAIEKQTAHIQDPEHKKDVAEAIRSLENDYACWFIKRHRDRVDDLACAIAQHIRAANTIWPSYRVEYLDRRDELNQALFQSTLPVGGATADIERVKYGKLHFNPRSPWGERQQKRF